MSRAEKFDLEWWLRNSVRSGRDQKQHFMRSKKLHEKELYICNFMDVIRQNKHTKRDITQNHVSNIHLLTRFPFLNIFPVSCMSPNSWMGMQPSWAWIRLGWDYNKCINKKIKKINKYADHTIKVVKLYIQTAIASKTLPIHFHVITFDLSFHRKPKKKILQMTCFSPPVHSTQYVNYEN